MQGRRPAGQRYTTARYRRAIHRACDRVFPAAANLRQRDGESKRQWTNRLSTAEQGELKAWQSQHRWSPNQFRHTMGTKTRERFGIEVVAASLGHARTDTSEIYAERNLQLAIQVAKDLGRPMVRVEPTPTERSLPFGDIVHLLRMPPGGRPRLLSLSLYVYRSPKMRRWLRPNGTNVKGVCGVWQPLAILHKTN